jgi:hypothetical protein
VPQLLPLLPLLHQLLLLKTKPMSHLSLYPRGVVEVAPLVSVLLPLLPLQLMMHPSLLHPRDLEVVLLVLLLLLLPLQLMMHTSLLHLPLHLPLVVLLLLQHQQR